MSNDSPVSLSIDGMSCASCVGRVERALSGVHGIAGVSANFATDTVRLTAAGPAALALAVQALQDLGYPARHADATLTVASMSCASCVGRVDRALRAVPGVLEVSVNLAAQTASVTYLQGATDPARLAATATGAGYAASVATGGTTRDRSDRQAAEARALSRRVAVAAALALPVFLMEMGSHLIPAVHMAIEAGIGRQASWLVQFALTTAVLAGPGRPFFRLGLPALLKGAPDMNSLVAVGTGAAYAYSVVATFLPALLPDAVRTVYYEAAAVIVVLILVGRWLEALSLIHI